MAMHPDGFATPGPDLSPAAGGGQYSPLLPYPAEPFQILGPEWDRLFSWAFRQGASDINVATDKPVRLEIHGKHVSATQRATESHEMLDLLSRLYGAHGQAHISQGRDFDVAYEVKLSRTERMRFRVNATGCLVNGIDGVQVTLRTLPGEPPRLQDMGFEPGILENHRPRNGIVMLCGPTGSGKTTALASMMRGTLEDANSEVKILTYESPIEFVYDGITGRTADIHQTEVPRHLGSFHEGIRNAMRRKPGIILVGECRDAETMAAAAEASLTGHCVYTTLHATDVPSVVRRMVTMFPAEERAQRAIDLMESSRLIVVQTLVPKVGEGRVPLREFLVVDEAVRDTLLDEPDMSRWPTITRKLLHERGQPMIAAARRAHAEGLISAETLRTFERSNTALARDRSNAD